MTYLYFFKFFVHIDYQLNYNAFIHSPGFYWERITFSPRFETRGLFIGRLIWMIAHYLKAPAVLSIVRCWVQEHDCVWPKSRLLRVFRWKTSVFLLLISGINVFFPGNWRLWTTTSFKRETTDFIRPLLCMQASWSRHAEMNCDKLRWWRLAMYPYKFVRFQPFEWKGRSSDFISVSSTSRTQG